MLRPHDEAMEATPDATTDRSAPIRVVIADDHPVVRNGLSALISSLPGFEVVGEAANGADAVREVQILHPDVIMMDIQMPVLDGIQATRRISVAMPDVAVLVLTMFDDDDTVFAAMRAGARGICSKGPSRQRSTGPTFSGRRTRKRRHFPRWSASSNCIPPARRSTTRCTCRG